MSNITNYPNCKFRTRLGNCDVVGGFCMSVENQICQNLHKISTQLTAEWVADSYEKDWETKYYNWHCSECGAEFGDSRPMWNYCPNCGAYMGDDGE